MFPLSDAIKTGLTVAGTAGVCFALHVLVAGYTEAKYNAQLKAQAFAISTQCEQSKQITEEASRDYQNKLATLNDELDRVKRLHANRCIPTVAKPTIGYNAAAGNEQLFGADGVFTDDLYDFARDAEQVGRQLDSCQLFINKERGL